MNFSRWRVIASVYIAKATKGLCFSTKPDRFCAEMKKSTIISFPLFTLTPIFELGHPLG